MLVYADSSDEEDQDEESMMDEPVGDGYSMQTHAGKRQDSLKEIVFLKDSKPGSSSFNEKQKGKRLTITSAGQKSKQIQLNSKQIAIFDQVMPDEHPLSQSDRRVSKSAKTQEAMIAVNEEQELELESPKSETMKDDASNKQQLFVSAMPDSPS